MMVLHYRTATKSLAVVNSIYYSSMLPVQYRQMPRYDDRTGTGQEGQDGIGTACVLLSLYVPLHAKGEASLFIVVDSRLVTTSYD